jgi:2-succinyl-6-hydroxy-2,4-cyclohexadiene-1-carboxylate synthase
VNGLVLLHGFTGSPASFDELTSQLSNRWHAPRIFRPALLGHEKSVRPEVRRFEQEVDRLAVSLERAGQCGAHLCGYSLGARVALGLIARHPFLFRSATLIGVHPGLAGGVERAERIGSDERWCRQLMHEGLQAFSMAWEEQPIFSSQRQLPEALTERQRGVRVNHSATGLMQCLRVLGLGQMPNYRGVFCAPPFEVKLVVGALDAKFVRIAEGAAGQHRRVHLEIVEGVGHNVLLEAPARLAHVLTEALVA